MLEVEGLALAYGAKRALDDVSLTVGEAELVGLVGHNGAGKTTLLRAGAGLLAPLSGTIVFDGRRVVAGETASLVRRGLGFVTQGNAVFRDLSVADNLAIAARLAHADSRIAQDDVFALFPILRERLAHRAGSLSGGQQQMLALAAALLRQPRLIMLDEPSTGLAPVLVDEVFKAIATLRTRFRVSFLVVDQNVPRLLALADRLYVLKAGAIVFTGRPSAIASDAELWRLF